jgi:hypothetical protein
MVILKLIILRHISLIFFLQCLIIIKVGFIAVIERSSLLIIILGLFVHILLRHISLIFFLQCLIIIKVGFIAVIERSSLLIMIE